MVTQQLSEPRTARATLARVTGACGITTLVLVLGASLVNGYQDVAFTSDSSEIVVFFRSIDDTLGAASSFLTAVGLIAMLWFTLGVALLLRPYDDEPPWRTAFLAGAGVVSVVSGQIASWDAAAYRSDDIDPQVARYAFDLGNLSFANGWVASGAVGICAGLVFLSARDLPSWLGWWAMVAGVGSVLGRAIWTHDVAFVPFALFWLWVGAVSVLLLAGRLALGRSRG
ncbi:MAG TPA: hypothetical protein VH228_05530 [Nocardioides sp.]|jgi:hypothetical protein|nr:hypothetical protein [Nocardioides sp.]